MPQKLSWERLKPRIESVEAGRDPRARPRSVSQITIGNAGKPFLVRSALDNCRNHVGAPDVLLGRAHLPSRPRTKLCLARGQRPHIRKQEFSLPERETKCLQTR
jgi:hypothetical protein